MAGRRMMELGPGEPPAGPWKVTTLEELVTCIRHTTGAPPGRPAVVAIDGRGGAGKSTIAERLHVAIPDSAVVHTDDIAWHHSFFGWSGVLADSVLAPLHGGRPVSFRPQAWEDRRRPGAIDVPAGLDFVLLEGTAAGRQELSHLVDAVVWVQSDGREAKRRALARDVDDGTAADPARAEAFWDEWMAEELPFFARDRPWDRACCFLAGTPVLEASADQVVIALP